MLLALCLAGLKACSYEAASEKAVAAGLQPCPIRLVPAGDQDAGLPVQRVDDQPVASLGWKKVDLRGMRRPASAIART